MNEEDEDSKRGKWERRNFVELQRKKRQKDKIRNEDIFVKRKGRKRKETSIIFIF